MSMIGLIGPRLTDPNSKIYANTSSPPFTLEIFEDVGNAVAVALLDHIG